MKKIKDVNLAFSCREKLEDTNEKDGRINCDQCGKLIHDFTNKNQEDLEKVLNNSSGKICGIFKASQLSKRFLKIAASTFLVTASTHAKSENDKNLEQILKDFEYSTETILDGNIYHSKMVYKYPSNTFYGNFVISNPEKDYLRYDFYGNTFPNHEYKEIIEFLQKSLQERIEEEVSTIIEFEIDVEGNITNTSFVEEINKIVEGEILFALNTKNIKYMPVSNQPVSFPFKVKFPFNFYLKDEDEMESDE